jgi:hypothetical protein
MITRTPLPDPSVFLVEDPRIRMVRIIVNFTSSVIMQSTLPRREGEALVASARAKILELFPGRDATYERVYGRRFRRLLDEFTIPEAVNVSHPC